MSHFSSRNTEIEGNPQNELDVHGEIEGAQGTYPNGYDQEEDLINERHNTVRRGLVQETVKVGQSRLCELPAENQEGHRAGY